MNDQIFDSHDLKVSRWYTQPAHVFKIFYLTKSPTKWIWKMVIYFKVPSYENQLISRVDLESTSSDSLLCTTVFVLVYFFWMASSVWWLILTFTWFLSAGLKWAHESISQYSIWYHIMAWIIPLIQTMIALLTSSVNGDPVSGENSTL